MPIDENKVILDTMYRMKYDEKIYEFEEIVKMCILKEITKDPSKAELLAHNKVKRLWNKYSRIHCEDNKNGVVTLFSIVNEYEKTLRWIGDTENYGTRRENYFIRPDLYKYFDCLDDRLSRVEL